MKLTDLVTPSLVMVSQTNQLTHALNNIKTRTSTYISIDNNKSLTNSLIDSLTECYTKSPGELHCIVHKASVFSIKKLIM